VRAALDVVERPQQERPVPHRPQPQDHLPEVLHPKPLLLHAGAQQRPYVVRSAGAARGVDDGPRQAQLRRLGGRVHVGRRQQPCAGHLHALKVRQRSGRGHEQLRQQGLRDVEPSPPGRREPGQHHAAR
jgi:hypothetical protein